MRVESFSEEFRQHHIQGMWFLPDGDVKATAQFIHGQGDFIARYEEVLELFVSHGVAVMGVDLPGHGESSGGRGDIPSLEYADSLIRRVNEIGEVRFPELPRGLLSHSMGGQLALRQMLFHAEYYQFTWLSSPLVCPSQNKSALEVSLLKQLVKVAPTLTVSTKVRRDLCRRLLNKQSRSKRSELFHKRISLRWGMALLTSEEIIRSELRHFASNVLITQGSLDTVTPPEFVEELVSKCTGEVSLEIIEGALHEPFLDITQSECYAIIQEWLEGVL